MNSLYKQIIEDWRELFYSVYFSVQKYKNCLIGSTYVTYANGFYQTLNLSIQQANKDKDNRSSKCLSTYIDKMLKYLQRYNLDEIVVTLEEKRKNPRMNQKRAPLQIEEMRGFPNYMRLKYGEYRIICMKSNDWKKLLFFGVFHRRDGYRKALDLLCNTLDKEGYALGLQPLSYKQKQLLLKEALDADSKIQSGRF